MPDFTDIFDAMELKRWCACSTILLFLVGRSATREREVEKPDEGYDSTGEVGSANYNDMIYLLVKLSIVQGIALLGEGEKEKQA